MRKKTTAVTHLVNYQSSWKRIHRVPGPILYIFTSKIFCAELEFDSARLLRPEFESGSSAWEAEILTTRAPELLACRLGLRFVQQVPEVWPTTLHLFCSSTNLDREKLYLSIPFKQAAVNCIHYRLGKSDKWYIKMRPCLKRRLQYSGFGLRLSTSTSRPPSYSFPTVTSTREDHIKLNVFN